MQTNFKAILKSAARVLAILPFAAVVAFGQQTINLTAAPTTTTLPDGTVVPMWGYFCGATVTGSTAACAALNPATSTWSPVVITVPTGQALTINLTNMLSFVPTGSTTTGTTTTPLPPNNIPTSIIIAGQVGGGLGVVGQRTTTPSPSHQDAQGCVTWFIAGLPPGTPCTTTTPIGTPPTQGPRVQSFSTEVAPTGATLVAPQVVSGSSLTWPALRAGTYLLESGTHPSIQVPMGLIGMLVVTTAPTPATTAAAAAPGTAYPAVAATTTTPAVPAVTYGGEVPLEFSEIDPVQNKAVDAAVRTPGFNEMNIKTFGDAVSAITVTNGGSGYTSNPTVTIAGGTGGSGATATASVGTVITGISLPSTGSGAGYTAPPAVTITGTSITTATAIAVMAVGAVTAPAAGTGSGYVVGDRVNFTGGGGAGASGTVAMVTATGTTLGAILTVNVTNPGSGYTSVPTAVVGGTGAILTPVLSTTTTGAVGSVTVTAGGSGYIVGDIVTFTGTATTAATATVGSVSPLGAILTITITNPGAGYTAAPTASVGGTLAALTVTLAVSGITVTSGGSGYAAPAATIPGPVSGTIALTVTTAGTTGAVDAITITNGGSRYSAPPTVTIAASPAGAAATATAVASLAQSCTPFNSTTGQASGAAAGCYPSAVNYTPFYYLINGLAFNKTNPAVSVFAPTAGTTTCLVGGVPTPCPLTTGITGTVLARLVNAGLRMHVPSIVNSLTTGFNGAGTAATVSGFTLIAEDGNVVPGVTAPRVQTDLFMAAGKTFDVMVHAPTGGITAIAVAAGGTGYCTGCTPAGSGMLPVTITGGGGTNATATATVVNGAITLITINSPGSGYFSQPTSVTVTDIGTAGTGFAAGIATLNNVGTLPIYDRELSLSANSSARDAGMLAYIGVNGGGLPAPVGGTTGLFAAAKANPDMYNALVAGQTFSVTDPSKGLIANDVNVYGVTLLAAPTNGTLTCSAVPGTSVAGLCANGTFTYTPNAAATSDTFTYCANNGITSTGCPANLTATVTLAKSLLTGNPTAIAQVYQAQTATYVKIASPGLLIGNSDPNNLPLSVVLPTTPIAGVVMDANGGFTASVTSGTTPLVFSYTVQNSQGRIATNTVTVNFPTPSNLVVNVVDAQAYSNCNGDSICIAGLIASAPITDYRWIIEEDKTFWVDPNCTTNQSLTAPGCPGVVPGPAGTTTVPSFGVNFHTSAMGFVAQGCTGPLSCESGQTMYDNRPACTSPGVPAGCSATSGQHIPAVCDVGNGACRPDPTPGCAATGPCPTGGTAQVSPASVHLDPSKRYYISVLPGDAGNPFPTYTAAPNCLATPYTTGTTLNTACGHTMGGSPIPPACNILITGCNSTNTTAFAPVTVKVLPTPLPTGKLSVIVFEDDFPLNGEQDSGGGVDVISPNEPGLGGFNIVLWDTYGGLGDVTGQDTYDMFNQPLSNSLAGTIDPSTNLDACPISPAVAANATGAGNNTGPAGPPTLTNPNPIGAQKGITGMIVTCPKYESDGKTLSPLAGQAIIANLMPEKFSVQAYPGADRIARGEEWIQTNTLDGQHPHDSFIRVGEPGYFQEYGPAGYHVSIGFANPAIINARHDSVCAQAFGPAGTCTNTITGQVNVMRMSRTPDERLYPSGSHDALAWTQCWASLGDPDAEDFEFTKCDADGNFTFTNVPGGNWRVTIGDQWNEQVIDGLSTPANVGGSCTAGTPGCTGGVLTSLNLGNIGVHQWQSNLYTTTFIDDNHNGIKDANEIGIPLIYMTVRYRDGHNSNRLVTDFNGVANFNETFPLFNWYVVEADNGRYKTTGIHTVYDAGGPTDGSTSCGPANGARACGTSTGYLKLANTFEALPLPADLSVPGAVYCAKADCTAEAASFQAGTAIPSSSTASTGRIDPPWVGSEGWAGLVGQSNWVEFGKAPFAACPPACVVTGTTTTTWGENGGIHGKVVYAATRPFDNADQMIEQPWSPYVPRVTVNLYQEGFAADGVTPVLKMVDTTTTSSWDDWAQGFWPGSSAGSAAAGAGQKPYMSCPGQGTATGTNADLFFFSLNDQPDYLDVYNAQHSTPAGTAHTLPYNSQYKCYDSMHIWTQTQPAPYDGAYQFPSSLGVNATTGKPLTTHGSTNGVTSNLAGTNCTICVPNPTTAMLPTGANADFSAYDPYRAGTPMLPPGKYVVEVVMPPGYEVYKEEDKNLLIGDNFIAPVTVQFAGLGGDIFIIPDQASVASMYDPSGAGQNPTNFQDPTTALGTVPELSGVPGFPGFQNPLWPCVGEARVVPDYLSLFPQAVETAPFAGAIRPLCDRKEVTLASQMSATNNFFIYTSAHIASHFTGVITDDFTAEFDPFSPQFGEKFAPPNQPVSTKDYLGNEISRVYSDHWGTYDGLVYSTWEVNPPNITGYSPNMMVQCMNDPGPILDTNPASPTFGQMITDPLFNPAYSNFCYEQPYMPGLTGYLDTPVVPTHAFVGAGYNNPDCAYPDATPAISEVDGDGIGPWVQAAGNLLTITALGDQTVNNYGYGGPSANAVPFNLKQVKRHYGFGASQGTGSVTIGGISATVANWGDTVITVSVPNGVPNCTIQQQAQYGGSAAQCGELVVTAGNGQLSIDAVTVTIGGKPPVHVPASQTIQSFIDAASPGDLIIVDPTCNVAGAAVSCASVPPGAPVTKTAAAHTEMVIMWKPVRLQGVGAASSIINANAHPAGKLLDPWRQQINCLFGLTLQGRGMAFSATSTPPGVIPFDPTGMASCPAIPPGSTTTNWAFYTGSFGSSTTNPNPQIDRLPSEGVIGWDATLNGNLAELLQEPSLLGAYEGAGITVLAKGVDMHNGNPWDQTLEGAFPTGTTLLTGVVSNPGGAPGTPGALLVGDGNPLCTDGAAGANRFPSNYMCNPSSIDGLGITNSSQGGGGIFLHGWAHFLQVANNRIYNNAGTLTGGISVGQGEFGPPYLVGGGAANLPPGSCSDTTGLISNQHEPWCLQVHVNVHNNMITGNSSIGDELFSATLSGGGGVTLCTGNDYYLLQYNWICGNLSSGEGGGVVHLGEIFNGDMEHNSVLFNESSNPTIPTNGGGIMVQGTPDTDPVCPGLPDSDCPTGFSDGTGPGLVINANLIQGNAADSGSGGGIRVQSANGTEVPTFASNPSRWNDVTITNNIIVNNVSGWDGAGISLQDALRVNITNNTIMHNDSLATSGVLINSIGTPQASAPPDECHNAAGTASCPQPAGVSSSNNSSLMTTAVASLAVTCPPNQGNCKIYSNPILANDIIAQNRAFYVGVGALGGGTQNQQKVVTLFDAFTNTAAPPQTSTGSCNGFPAAGSASYWDVGARGDRTVTGHESHITLTPTYSVLSPNSGYSGNGNSFGAPSVIASYCNGSRVPPECTTSMGCAGPNGFGTPPGIADAVSPNPVFSLTPAATVDEGNNWINVFWGPLSMTNPASVGLDGNFGAVAPLGNYALRAATDNVPATQSHPATDFFGNPRPENGGDGRFDAGAVEVGPAGPATVLSASLTPGVWNVSHVRNCPGTTLAEIAACNLDGTQVFVLTNTGTVRLTGIGQAVLGGTALNMANYSVVRLASTCGPAGNGQLMAQPTLAPGASCVVTVQFKPLIAQPAGFKPATISVTDSAGTQTSALNGLAQ